MSRTLLSHKMLVPPHYFVIVQRQLTSRCIKSVRRLYPGGIWKQKPQNQGQRVAMGAVYGAGRLFCRLR